MKNHSEKEIEERLNELNSKEEKLYKKYLKAKNKEDISSEIQDFLRYCTNERQENHGSKKYSSELSKKIMRWGERWI